MIEICCVCCYEGKFEIVFHFDFGLIQKSFALLVVKCSYFVASCFVLFSSQFNSKVLVYSMINRISAA